MHHSTDTSFNAAMCGHMPEWRERLQVQISFIGLMRLGMVLSSGSDGILRKCTDLIVSFTACSIPMYLVKLLRLGSGQCPV